MAGFDEGHFSSVVVIMLDPKDNALRTAIENGEGSLIVSGFPDVLALEIF